MSDRVRCRVVVGGQVQGVGFRFWTTREATGRGVTGWVTNLRDGTVQAELEGTPAAVDEVIRWFRAGGPASARVDDVTVDEVGPEGSASFEIR